MKLVKMFDDHDRWKSKKALKEALNLSPQKALSLSDMRARCKVMDLIEKTGGGDLVLEDADHKVLLDSVNAYPWAIADPALVKILDAVEYAEKAPAGMTPPEV